MLSEETEQWTVSTKGWVIFLACRIEITLYCAENRLWQVKGKEEETSRERLQEEVSGDGQGGAVRGGEGQLQPQSLMMAPPIQGMQDKRKEGLRSQSS